MNSRIEEQITSIEYNRAMYRLRNATSENERIQLRDTVRWLGQRLEEFRRENDTRVQAYEKKDSTREYQICGLCGGKITRPDDLSQDHIEPKSQNGPTVASNLLPAHVKCNNERGCLPLKEWYMLQNYRRGR